MAKPSKASGPETPAAPQEPTPTPVQSESVKPTEPEAPKTGTDIVRPLGLDGVRRVVIPGPQLDQPRKTSQPNAAQKKPDPNKAKDVNVTSQHLIKTLARTMADNRMTKLRELARRNNDVRWLLAEYEKLNAPKPTTT